MSAPEHIQITLNDEPLPNLAAGATCAQACADLRKRHTDIVSVSVNGEARDWSWRLQEGDVVRTLGFDDPEGQYVFWHSSAHLLAQAVLRLFPEAKPTIGPPIENGFYYDFANLSVSEKDFEAIEQEMQRIIKERLPIERIDYASLDEAMAEFGDNPYKLELIQQFGENLSAYKQGEFIDLCRGNHLEHTGIIKAIKIMKTSGAYWRGDATGDQLVRIYGISFPQPKQLKQHLHLLEEAKKRDHRVWGKKLDLFSFHEEAPGMPFFHPKGMILWGELIKFWQECHDANGYTQIKTPMMLNRELWVRSGHWENYRENMYTSQIDEYDYAIKPMNCPGCLLYYKTKQYSYRQLPLRIGEIGHVHRHELSGALSGLFRVRSFHQDDAHVFMTEEQISAEVANVIGIADTIYSRFGLGYAVELSTRPEKSIGSDHSWEMATAGLQAALDSSGLDYRINEGDGAFYGPKIDFHIKDALGRTWQCGTIQLDLNLPERFDITYDASDGGKKRPVMIHRTIYGSLERFLGVIIEHYAGKLPLWLAPEHVRLLTIADRHLPYAQELAQTFSAAGLRVNIDTSVESINKKVRQAQTDQVNYMLILGDQEVEANTVNLRTRSNQRIGAISSAEFVQKLQAELQSRSPNSGW